MATIEETTELPLNLHEYEAAARDLLSPMTLGYVSGGPRRGNAAREPGRIRPLAVIAPRDARAARGLHGDDGVGSGRRAPGADRALGTASPGARRRRAGDDPRRARRRHDLHHEHRLHRADGHHQPGGCAVVVPALSLQRPRHLPRPGERPRRREPRRWWSPSTCPCSGGARRTNATSRCRTGWSWPTCRRPSTCSSQPRTAVRDWRRTSAPSGSRP